MNHVNVLERPARSQFLRKLHRLLESPTDPTALRWTSEVTFEIAIQDDLAIAALRPEFEFRSLGSFVRQLSYYNFKRLSDRRRSSERGTAKKGFIRFTHQSGYFTRGDASQISRITRRPRSNRPAVRRPSNASCKSQMSAGSDEREGSYPAVAWATQDSSTPYYHGEGSSFDATSNSGPFASFTPVPGDGPAPAFANKWRNYSPATAGFTNPARDNAAAVERQRRASMPVLDYSSNEQYQDARQMMTSPSSAPPTYAPLPSVAERRPTHRTNYSTNSIPTLSRLPEIPQPQQSPQQQPLALPQHLGRGHGQGGGQVGFRASEYPTPAFDSSTNVFFTQPTFVPPPPRGATNLPTVPRSSQAKNFLSELKFDPTYYGPTSAHGSPPMCAAALPSPSEHGSMGTPSPHLSPTHELPPSSTVYASIPPRQPQQPTSPYYEHYSPSSNHTHSDAVVSTNCHGHGSSDFADQMQSRQPRRLDVSQQQQQASIANADHGYFPYQPHAAFGRAPWSPNIPQA
ncbi:hypothetical protein JCM3766R1_001398 [Sporobolomyces carnicolor]